MMVSMSSRQLANAMASTVVPYLGAIWNRVSPVCTIWTCQLGGGSQGMGVGVSVGVGVVVAVSGAVGDSVDAGVAVGVNVAVSVSVGVTVFVTVGESVGVTGPMMGRPSANANTITTIWQGLYSYGKGITSDIGFCILGSTVNYSVTDWKC